MRLERMGCFFPTRISFMRALLRRLSADRAVVSRPVWEVCPQGYGRAVYSLTLGGHTYSLLAISTRLDPDARTDRVIAEAWDSSFVLYDGVPDAAERDRLAANVPLQEAGRFEPTDLVLSRANKSVRLFSHVIDRLAAGLQPDPQAIRETGYLMRTTAVYGNGKFGIADRAALAERPGLAFSFAAEMLAVWLIRGFTHDLVDHIARHRNPAAAVGLDRASRRHLGIGNSTGLGMAPFLVTHPILLNNWMMSRETALARVRAVERAEPDVVTRLYKLLERVSLHLEEWITDDRRQMQRIEGLRGELSALRETLTPAFINQARPWEALLCASESGSLECQELIVSVLIELYPDLVDGLCDRMLAPYEPRLDPAMTIGNLTHLLNANYGFALDVDFDDPEATALFWYVSEQKLEPRLGRRHEEPGAELEMPLDIARQAQALAADLAKMDATARIAEFLLHHPEHRNIVRRVQASAHHAYMEIRDNLIGEGCLPIDMLRCKLSFFGASKFDPKSDRWTRINLYQGAPLFDELESAAADDWWLPALGHS